MAGSQFLPRQQVASKQGEDRSTARRLNRAFCNKKTLDAVLKSAYDSNKEEIRISKCHGYLFGSFF